jgi:hypothetical protein
MAMDVNLKGAESMAQSPTRTASLPQEEQAQHELLVRTARNAGFTDAQWRAMFFETGPYDITVPTVALSRFAELLLERCARPVA